MQAFAKLHSLLDWKLLSGSHVWPGPAGGTCINEAAIVAAGFEYRAVSSHRDCPPCFCPVIADYLITLNDALADDDRQQLMRFVLRLSGSKDAAVEEQRQNLIIVETARRITAAAMRASYLPEWAAALAAVETPASARSLMPKAAAPAARCWAAREAWAAGLSRTKEADSAGRAAEVFNAAWQYGWANDLGLEVRRASAAHVARAAWERWACEALDQPAISTRLKPAESIIASCIAIVEGALAMGNQADAIECDLAAARMAEARERVREAA